MSPAPTPKTARGRTGIVAEEAARRFLGELGWSIVGRNVVVGRGELDLVALDPGEPGVLVIVEVRGARTGRFGAPEESVDGRKLARTWAAAGALMRSAWPARHGIAARAMRIDVVAVDLRWATGPDMDGPTIRHLRGVTAT